VLSRPDKLRASRTGGYNDVEYVFDGRTFTLNDRDSKAYAQAEFTCELASNHSCHWAGATRPPTSSLGSSKAFLPTHVAS